MIFKETSLNDAFTVQIEKIEDNRGYFATTFAVPDFEAHGLNAVIRQTSSSFNKLQGTVRGMHFQLPPYAENKLVRCVHGAIYDVIVDLRPDSPTFKKWQGFELSEENMLMYYIPEGFAHGYQTLTDNAEVAYMLTQVYSPQHARGVRHDDSEIGIKWPLPITVLSKRDEALPSLRELMEKEAAMRG
jgi:dTDP-4-dehydrorhamnose 3,5-epimerase